MTRTKNGQFAPGNPGGPGRPKRATETEYLLAISEVVTLDDWREIVARAVAQSKRGDPSARKWLAEYLLPTMSMAQAELLQERLDDPNSVENILRKMG